MAHLRLIALDGKLIGPPPPKQASGVAEALAVMRLSAAILAREPDDEHGYSREELAAQYAATDRMVQAFRVLDRLLGHHPSIRGVSKNGHPKPPRETRNGVPK